MRKRQLLNGHERYGIERSPLSQKPTKRDLAALLHETKGNLETLATPRFKEQFVVRRIIQQGTKERSLVYPEGRLRAIHERLKFHLNKIVQPPYLLCPRKNKSQRDNARVHLENCQYLTLDIKQFYPSTTRAMIRESLCDQFGMFPDVAGLIAHLATSNDKAFLGSPLTPVLASLVYRRMFDQIYELCVSKSLDFSVWVDDLTISGERIEGSVISEIRRIIASAGLKSHKLKLRTGNRAVFITGVGIVGSNLVVPRYLELRSKELWAEFNAADSFDEIDTTSTRLLGHLGGIRHVVGKSSERGQKISSEMNSIRQKRMKAHRAQKTATYAETKDLRVLSDHEKDLLSAEIAAIAF